MKKKNILSGFIRGRGSYVLNQTPKVFEDRRTKRQRTRADKLRRALEEGKEDE